MHYMVMENLFRMFKYYRINCILLERKKCGLSKVVLTLKLHYINLLPSSWLYFTHLKHSVTKVIKKDYRAEFHLLVKHVSSEFGEMFAKLHFMNESAYRRLEKRSKQYKT